MTWLAIMKYIWEMLQDKSSSMHDSYLSLFNFDTEILHDLWQTFIEIDKDLDKTYNCNFLGKGMNPSLLPPTMGK